MKTYVNRARRGWDPKTPHPGFDEFVDNIPTGKIVGATEVTRPVKMPRILTKEPSQITKLPSGAELYRPTLEELLPDPEVRAEFEEHRAWHEWKAVKLAASKLEKIMNGEKLTPEEEAFQGLTDEDRANMDAEVNQCRYRNAEIEHSIEVIERLSPANAVTLIQSQLDKLLEKIENTQPVTNLKTRYYLTCDWDYEPQLIEVTDRAHALETIKSIEATFKAIEFRNWRLIEQKYEETVITL